jgi:hypothetical protein
VTSTPSSSRKRKSRPLLSLASSALTSERHVGGGREHVSQQQGGHAQWGD